MHDARRSPSPQALIQEQQIEIFAKVAMLDELFSTS